MEKEGEKDGNGGHLGEEEVKKKMEEASHASLCSMDEEEEEEGEKNAFLLGPQVTIKEQLEMDKVMNS